MNPHPRVAFFAALTWTGQKPRSGYPEDPKTLGEHLIKKRMDLGLSQSRLAARLGVNADTLRNWERRRTSPMPALLSRAVRFLEE